MRELNVCEVGEVSGGWLGCDLGGASVNGALSSRFGGTVGNIGGALTTAMCNQIADAIGNGTSNGYGNGNGATGPGYSGAGIGGNVPSGSTGSSHFG